MARALRKAWIICRSGGDSHRNCWNLTGKIDQNLDNFEQTIHQKQIKDNIECVFKHSIACASIKRHFFSQEILGEEHIVPPGSHKENRLGYWALRTTIAKIVFLWPVLQWEKWTTEKRKENVEMNAPLMSLPVDCLNGGACNANTRTKISSKTIVFHNFWPIKELFPILYI